MKDPPRRKGKDAEKSPLWRPDPPSYPFTQDQ